MAVEATDQLSLEADREVAVDELVNQHWTAGIVDPLWRRRQLQEEPLEGNGVVLLDDSLVLG